MDEARYWAHPTDLGVNLMHARFVRHAFGRHSHPTFAIGVIEGGVEKLRIAGTTEYVTAGGLALINPDVVHTGSAADAGGWTYRVVYPPVTMMREVTGSTSPWFEQSIAYDATAARAVVAAQRASADGDRLAASTTLRILLHGLWRRYGTTRQATTAPRADARHVAAAREILHDTLVDPPTLDELADAVGAGRYALVRAFGRHYGLPPHAYLNEQRVRRACALLDAGATPSDVAVEVGFADQPHLTRHFRRIVGVPPGQYRRKNVQDFR